MKSKITNDFFQKGQAEHTKVKLGILNNYVIPWMRKIVLNPYGNGACSIVDTFAGAGIYSDGSEGSPIILLKAAIDFFEQANNNNFSINKIILTFIEKDIDNYRHLKNNIEGIIGEKLKDNEINECKKYSNLSIGIANSTHENFIEELTEKVDRIIPTLFFMDPFGFNLPFELNKKILSKYSNVELIINFMYEEVNRFITVNTVEKNMKVLFGTEELSQITQKLQDAGAKQRSDVIKGTYINNLLNSGAKYTLDFDIHTSRGPVKMSIIYATKNINGFDTMKSVLDDFSNTDEFEYIPEQKNDNSQLILDVFNLQKDKGKELANYLYDFFKTKDVSVKTLHDKSMEHSTIPSKYLKKALAYLDANHKIERIYRLNEKKIRKNSYPDDARIKFV